MRAVCKTEFGCSLVDLPKPKLVNDSDLLIHIIRAAVCRTDLYVAKGLIPTQIPRVLGHEFSGLDFHLFEATPKP
jgi:Zn-dependent alcohol dehydrogenase